MTKRITLALEKCGGESEGYRTWPTISTRTAVVFTSCFQQLETDRCVCKHGDRTASSRCLRVREPCSQGRTWEYTVELWELKIEHKQHWKIESITYLQLKREAHLFDILTLITIKSFVVTVVIQSLSHVQPFATPQTVARQASLPFTISWSLLKFMSIESVMQPTISSSFVPFSSCLQSFPESGSFQMNQFFASGGQSIGFSTSASLLPMNIQGWFLLGLTGLNSLQSRGLLRVFSSTTVQKPQLFSGQPSLRSN